MKKTGVTRKVDELGRIVIPMELRNKLKIDEKDAMEVYVDNNSIILKKVENTCVFCEGKKNIILYKDRPICQKCLDDIKNMKLSN